MKTIARLRFSHHLGLRDFLGCRSFRLTILGLACLAAGVSNLGAQNIIQSAPEEALPPPAMRKQATPPPLSRPPPPPDSPYRIGSVVLHPRLSYKHLNADGLPARGRRVESEIRTVSPGITLDFGENWTLDYNPTWVSYASPDLVDSTDEALRLSGILAVQDWSFDFSQSYGESNSPMVETAAQTDQKSWATLLGAVYRHSPKLQLEFSGSLNERYTDLAPDLKTWTGRAAFNYLLTSQVSLNVGPEFTYTEVANEPDYFGESFMARLNWRPADTFNVGIGGGVQYTHSKSASGLDLSNPLLNLSVGYQPFETTTLGATVSRTVSSSYFRAQATESLSWGLNLSQRLLGKIYLGASYSRQESDYVALQKFVLAGRTDEVEAFSFRLSTRMLRRLAISLVYQESKNSSNLAAFSYSSSQYGIELAYRY